MNEKYINLINETTLEQFDCFGTNVQADTIAAIHAPAQNVNMCADSLCRRTVKQWAKLGLLNAEPDQAWSVADVALANILSVLKKRGLPLNALRQITEYLNAPMYKDISGLDFLVLLCRQQDYYGLSLHLSPVLVVDGDNRVFIAMAQDLHQIFGNNPYGTYSGLVLNIREILAKCDFIYKINASQPAEFMEMPAQIVDRFFEPGVERMDINIAKQRMQTTRQGGNAPAYGERTIKYQDGHVVTEQIGATWCAINNIVFSDWTNQSQNAIQGVSRWLCCHLNMPDVL